MIVAENVFSYSVTTINTVKQLYDYTNFSPPPASRRVYSPVDNYSICVEIIFTSVHHDPDFMTYAGTVDWTIIDMGETWTRQCNYQWAKIIHVSQQSREKDISDVPHTLYYYQKMPSPGGANQKDVDNILTGTPSLELQIRY